MFAACSFMDAKNQAEMEADAFKTAYSDEFASKVYEAYGDAATLENIEGEIKIKSDVMFGSAATTGYTSTDRLTGNIIYNGKSYKAVYDTETGLVKDEVHNEIIFNEIIDSLPINKNLMDVYYCDESFETPMFDSSVTCLEDAAKEKGHITLVILVKDNLSKYPTERFTELETFNCLDKGDLDINIRIIAVSNFENSDKLKKDAAKIRFYASPKIYNSSTGSYEDVFKVYKIWQILNIEESSDGWTYRLF